MSLSQCTAPTDRLDRLPAYRFLHGEVEGGRPLTFSERSLHALSSDKQHPERESGVGSVVFLEFDARVSLLS